jgi:hypothetical protein
MTMHAECVTALSVLERAIDTLPPSTSPGHREPGVAAMLCTAPVLYGLAIPLALLDLSVSTYQWICFPILGIERVARRPYFVFDRALLPYLDPLQKVNCAYCSYANGLLAYVREIAARTEQYWCPLRNRRMPQDAHDRYRDFVTARDAAELRQKIAALRAVTKSR